MTGFTAKQMKKVKEGERKPHDTRSPSLRFPRSRRHRFVFPDLSLTVLP